MAEQGASNDEIERIEGLVEEIRNSISEFRICVEDTLESPEAAATLLTQLTEDAVKRLTTPIADLLKGIQERDQTSTDRAEALSRKDKELSQRELEVSRREDDIERDVKNRVEKEVKTLHQKQERAKAAEENAKAAEESAKAAEESAKAAEESAKAAEKKAKVSVANAKIAETNWSTAETESKTAEANAAAAELKAKVRLEAYDEIVQKNKLQESAFVGRDATLSLQEAKLKRKLNKAEDERKEVKNEREAIAKREQTAEQLSTEAEQKLFAVKSLQANNDLRESDMKQERQELDTEIAAYNAAVEALTKDQDALKLQKENVNAAEKTAADRETAAEKIQANLQERHEQWVAKFPELIKLLRTSEEQVDATATKLRKEVQDVLPAAQLLQDQYSQCESLMEKILRIQEDNKETLADKTRLQSEIQGALDIAHQVQDDLKTKRIESFGNIGDAVTGMADQLRGFDTGALATGITESNSAAEKTAGQVKTMEEKMDTMLQYMESLSASFEEQRASARPLGPGPPRRRGIGQPDGPSEGE